MAPFLALVGAPGVASSEALVVSLSDWRMRAEAETQEVLPWLIGWQRLPWRRRPAYLMWSLWLNDAHFRALSDEPMSRWEVMRARGRRVRRSLSAFPKAFADLRQPEDAGGRNDNPR